MGHLLHSVEHIDLSLYIYITKINKRYKFVFMHKLYHFSPTQSTPKQSTPTQSTPTVINLQHFHCSKSFIRIHQNTPSPNTHTQIKHMDINITCLLSTCKLRKRGWGRSYMYNSINTRHPQPTFNTRQHACMCTHIITRMVQPCTNAATWISHCNFREWTELKLNMTTNI